MESPGLPSQPLALVSRQKSQLLTSSAFCGHTTSPSPLFSHSTLPLSLQHPLPHPHAWTPSSQRHPEPTTARFLLCHPHPHPCLLCYGGEAPQAPSKGEPHYQLMPQNWILSSSRTVPERSLSPPLSETDKCTIFLI